VMRPIAKQYQAVRCEEGIASMNLAARIPARRGPWAAIG
jgi:hypothetical protein